MSRPSVRTRTAASSSLVVSSRICLSSSVKSVRRVTGAPFSNGCFARSDCSQLSFSRFDTVSENWEIRIWNESSLDRRHSSMPFRSTGATSSSRVSLPVVSGSYRVVRDSPVDGSIPSARTRQRAANCSPVSVILRNRSSLSPGSVPEIQSVDSTKGSSSVFSVVRNSCRSSCWSDFSEVFRMSDASQV